MANFTPDEKKILTGVLHMVVASSKTSLVKGKKGKPLMSTGQRATFVFSNDDYKKLIMAKFKIEMDH